LLPIELVADLCSQSRIGEFVSFNPLVQHQANQSSPPSVYSRPARIFSFTTITNCRGDRIQLPLERYYNTSSEQAERHAMEKAKSASVTSSGSQGHAKKQSYYAVRRGHKPGIYLNWNDAKQQITGFKNNQRTRSQFSLSMLSI